MVKEIFNEVFSLVFEDWKRDNDSIYDKVEGQELSLSSLHSGSTFKCNVVITDDEREILEKAFNKGIYPIFRLMPRNVEGGNNE